MFNGTLTVTDLNMDFNYIGKNLFNNNNYNGYRIYVDIMGKNYRQFSLLAWKGYGKGVESEIRCVSPMKVSFY